MRDYINPRALKLKRAYEEVFGGESQSLRLVLADLKSFCRGMGPAAAYNPKTGNLDPYASMIAVGRKEVWDRILSQVHMPDKVLTKLQLNEELGDDDE